MSSKKKAAARCSRRASRPALRTIRPQRASADAVATDQVYERIWTAIIEHSLPPDTRLVEGELCQIFGVGRTRMRQVLQRLAHERVVTVARNRGATVSRPTIEEAREVFGARMVIEAGVVEAFLARSTRRDIRMLEEHVAREDAAWRRSDRRAMLKLSGEFHLRLADAAGNRILAGLLRDLVSRSSLIIAVYQSPTAQACPPDEHRELTGMLERRERAAIRRMVHHLEHVGAGLHLDETADGRVDLRAVLADRPATPL